MRKVFELLFLSLAIVFTGHLAYSQASQGMPPSLIFNEDTASLGRFKLVGQEPVVHHFEFQVLPGRSLSITEVKPDCACSIADYPSRRLEGGDIGSITVRFNPYKHGSFEKNFTVMMKDSQGREGTEVLQIRGYIEPEKPQVDLDFPYKCGNLLLKNRLISFGGIGDKTLVRQKIEIYNSGDTPVSFLDSMQLPSYVEVVMDTPRVIPPRSICEAFVYYHPELRGSFGYALDNIQLFTDDSEGAVVELEVAAAVQPESFVKKDDSPRVWVSAPVIDLGEIPASAGLNREFIVNFVLYNKGQGDLNIADIETGTGIDLIGLSKNKVDRGESAQLKLKVKGMEELGEYEHVVTVHTNDPEQPKVYLKIKAKLK